VNQAPGEHIEGIGVPLPPGERVRWQGAPGVRSLARHAFHARKVAVYFTALALWRLLVMVYDGRPAPEVAGAAAWLLLLGGAAVAVSWLLAYWCASTTVYAITDRRVVMRVGMVVSSIINIPFRQIHRADWRGFADGSGDIVLAVPPVDAPPYFHLWPHARPWQWSRPQPALRSVPEAAHVAALLQEAALSVTGAAAVPAEPAMRQRPVQEPSA
jgi:hypothetical protein